MNNNQMSQLTSLLVEAAHHYRLAQEAYGARKLKQCLTIIEQLNGHPSFDQIMQVMPEMITAQENHDWLGLADILEFELTAFIGSNSQH
ncbi:hypothetical protein [Shewanella waksmanii]|uniref:hypothetical protein n=1 Tax=Shewanella waksmanii TaxID=213783 RepID=UPI0004B4F932|nr:hypothetical protein [Shewanella waksmanii]